MRKFIYYLTIISKKAQKFLLDKYCYKLEGNDLIEIKPSDFSYDKDWDLKCYYQSGRNYMFIK